MGRVITAPGQGWAHRGPCLFRVEGAEASNSVVGYKASCWALQPVHPKTHSHTPHRGWHPAEAGGVPRRHPVREGGADRGGEDRAACRSAADGATGQGSSLASPSRALPSPPFRQNLVTCANSEPATPNHLGPGRSPACTRCQKRTYVGRCGGM